MRDASIDAVESAHRRDGFRAFTREHNDAQRHGSLTRDIRRRRDLADADGCESARDDVTENNPRVRKFRRRVDEIAHRDADHRVSVVFGAALERARASARPLKTTTEDAPGTLRARRAPRALERRRRRDHSREDRGTRERHRTRAFARRANARTRPARRCDVESSRVERRGEARCLPE